MKRNYRRGTSALSKIGCGFRLVGLGLILLAVFACASRGSSVPTSADSVSQTTNILPMPKRAVVQTEEWLPLAEGMQNVDADIGVVSQLGHTTSVSVVAHSPDGKTIASSSDNAIILWETVSGRQIRTFIGHSGSVTFIAYSPDSKTIASSSEDNTAKLWDVATGKEIRTLTGHTDGPYIGGVTSIAYSPDGRTVATSAGDTKIKLWDAATGREIRTFTGFTHIAKSVTFSPDGRTIVSASFSHIDNVKLWDVASGRETRSLKLDNYYGYPVFVTISPDGKHIASGYDHGNIILWDTISGRQLRSFKGSDKSVAFSPDGKTLTFGLDNSIKIMDTTSGREIRTFIGHSGLVRSLKFSPDGKTIISGSSDKTLKQWDVASGREIRTFAGQLDDITSVAYSPNGKFIASGSNDKTVKLWDVDSGKLITTFSGHSSRVISVVFSPDGKTIAFGSYGGGGIKLWDVAARKEIKTFTNIGSKSIAFSPDGKYIASSDGFDIKLLDIATGDEIKTFKNIGGGSIAFSPDGKQLVSNQVSALNLWDVTSGNLIKTLSKLSFSSSVAFSPDGKTVSSNTFVGGDVNSTHRVKVWDVATGKEIWSFNDGGDSYIKYSPDGRTLVFGSKDGVVKQMDLSNGREIRRFTGHTGAIKSVVFSPDGKTLATGSQDGTIRIWDIATGKEIAKFISFSGSDTQLAFATRGLTVETATASSSNEGEWLSITPDGYYQASPRGDRYLNVQVNNTVSGIDSYRSVFYNPDVVQARLQRKPDPASKSKVTIQQVANFTPPSVTIQSPANFSVTNTAIANLSVAISGEIQPIRNIRIFINGRPIGRNELAAFNGTALQPERASLTVAGNQKTVNFTVPIDLDPGANRIEVVAFNGYSETRRYVDVMWNAPAGQRPLLPNLWILTVGVNAYDNAGVRLAGLGNLNYCVADAKGLIASLKAQEGRRYAKVNSLIIADGETLAPTATNIRQNLKFLDQAEDRDIVLLFMAGHGISAEEGKFFFLPKDAVFTGNKVVDTDFAISGDEMTAVLEGSGNRLLFIDACQSGGVDNDRMVRTLQESNAFVFTASRGNELSYEDPRWGHGAFTYSILNALKGAPAALAEGNVSVRSMSGFVSIEVPRLTSNRQNPQIHSLLYSDFPMAVIK